MKRKFLILLCLVLFIVSVSCVSAAENTNQTVDGISSVSTIDNIDQTNDTLGVFENVEELSAKDDGTFKALQEKIDNAPAGSTITLENDYVYDESFDSWGLIIDKKLTIDGNGFIINCTSKSRAFECYNDGIVLNNINFYNGFRYGSNNIANGGAIYSECTLTINNCNFFNNVASKPYGGAKGGAIYSTKDLKLTNCEFNNNSATSMSGADDGGSIYCESKISLSNCTFQNHLMEIICSNSFVICDSKFYDNHIDGPLFTISGPLDVNNSIFVNNVYESFVSYAKNGTLNNATFINNSAPSDAIVDAYCFKVISDCLFVNNGAYYGIIYIDESNTVADCTFDNNNASCGGAIYFSPYLYSNTVTKSMLSNLNFKKHLNDYSGLISVSDNILILDGQYNPSAEVTVNIADKIFKTDFNSETIAKIDLNSLSSGTYDTKITFQDNKKSAFAEITLPITIESSTVLDVSDVTKDYGGSENLEITLTESGSPIANAKVNININGGDYTRTTDSNGKASMPINLNAGTYDAVVSYEDVSATAKVTVNQLTTETILTYTKNSHNCVTLTASVNPSSAGGKVTFNVNGKDYTATVSDAKATYTLNNLAVGSYDAKATYQGDVNHKSSSSSNVKFTVEEHSIIVSAPDVTKYYGGDERFVVSVTDNAGKAIANEPVKVTINGQVYDRKTGADGRTTFAINLRSGTHEATTEHDGEVITSTITVKTTVISKNVTKIFRNGTNYEASFLDKNGNKAPAGEKVSININGVFYQRTIKDDGSISFALNLEQGTYILTMTNPYTGEEISNTVKILPNIVENKDLVKYYRNGSQFTFKLLDDKGNPASGQKASININGVFYTRTTNDKGIATFQINLEPGTYVLTMEYKGCRVSNTVTVLSVIKSSDIKMKYQDGTRFKVTVLDGVGKPYAKQNLTFNINGVFYYRTTKDDGSTSLAINLMAGEYIITTTYGTLNVSNKITISS